MKHPTHEEWVPYLFGEATAEVRHRLGAHLEDCPECRAEIEAWQRSRRKLDAWTLSPPVRRADVREPVLRLAFAAAVILVLGLVIGRFTAPASAGVDQLRAEVAASVKSAVAAEFRAELARTQSHTSNVLAAFETRLANAWEIGSSQLLRGFAETFAAAREDDRRATLTLLEQIQRENLAGYVALRRDLETVASMTDDELRQARSKIIEVAANLRTPPID